MCCIKTPSVIQHLISFVTGFLSLYFLFSTSVCFILLLALFSHILLSLTTFFQCVKYRSLSLIVFTFLYLVICELYLVDERHWHRIRGSQMIIVMKTISLALDLDLGKMKTAPSVIEFIGNYKCF